MSDPALSIAGGDDAGSSKRRREPNFNKWEDLTLMAANFSEMNSNNKKKDAFDMKAKEFDMKAKVFDMFMSLGKKDAAEKVANTRRKKRRTLVLLILAGHTMKKRTSRRRVMARMVTLVTTLRVLEVKLS
jgi:hypothetical protein